MKPVIFVARDEAATDRLGSALADLLPPGAVVAMEGPLGAGKTRLVQAIAVALGVPRRDVVSPTFVLCRQYEGRRTIHHLDAYRLRDEDEFLELGPEEYFHSEGLTLIEWSDRVVDCLPPDRLEIGIEAPARGERRFCITATHPRFHSLLRDLEARLGPNRGSSR